MNDRTNIFAATTTASNQQERPLRRRHVSFNVLPIREESTPTPPSPTPILVDYSSIRERRQLNLSDFLHSDNPVTFFLFTFLRAIRLFGKIFILPFIVIKYLYLLMLRVYGVRRPTPSTTPSDLFSISSSQSSTSPQQRPIVWILTVIDYVIVQLASVPDLIRHIITSIRRHIDGTVSKSFNLIDSCTSHQLTNAYSMFRRIFLDKNTDLNLQTRR
mgnify:CR=1 FL=1